MEERIQEYISQIVKYVNKASGKSGKVYENVTEYRDGEYREVTYWISERGITEQDGWFCPEDPAVFESLRGTPEELVGFDMYSMIEHEKCCFCYECPHPEVCSDLPCTCVCDGGVKPEAIECLLAKNENQEIVEDLVFQYDDEWETRLYCEMSESELGYLLENILEVKKPATYELLL